MKLKMYGEADEYYSDTGLITDGGDREETDTFWLDTIENLSNDNRSYNDGDKFQNPAIKSLNKVNYQHTNIHQIIPTMLDDNNDQYEPSKKVKNCPAPIESNLDKLKLEYADCLENGRCRDTSFSTSNAKNDQTPDEEFENTLDNNTKTSKRALSPSSSRLLHKIRQCTNNEVVCECGHYYRIERNRLERWKKKGKKKHTNQAICTEDRIEYSKFNPNISDGDSTYMGSSTSKESYQRDVCLNTERKLPRPRGLKITVVGKCPIPLEDDESFTYNSNTDDNYEYEESANCFDDDSADNFEETNMLCDGNFSSNTFEEDSQEYSEIPVCEEEVEYQSGYSCPTTSKVDEKLSVIIALTNRGCRCSCHDKITKTACTNTNEVLKITAQIKIPVCEKDVKCQCGDFSPTISKVNEKLSPIELNIKKTTCTNTNKALKIPVCEKEKEIQCGDFSTTTSKVDEKLSPISLTKRQSRCMCRDKITKTTCTNTTEDLKIARHKTKEAKCKFGIFNRKTPKVDEKISPIVLTKCQCDCACYNLETVNINKDLEIISRTIKEAEDKSGPSCPIESKENNIKLSHIALGCKKGSIAYDDGIRKELNYEFSSLKLETVRMNTNKDLEIAHAIKDLRSAHNKTKEICDGDSNRKSNETTKCSCKSRATDHGEGIKCDNSIPCKRESTKKNENNARSLMQAIQDPYIEGQSLLMDHDGLRNVLMEDHDKEHNTNSEHSIESTCFHIKNDRSDLTVDIDDEPLKINESIERKFPSNLTMYDEHVISSDSDISYKFSRKSTDSISSNSFVPSKNTLTDGRKLQNNENGHKTTIPKCVLEHLKDHNVPFHIVKISEI